MIIWLFQPCCHLPQTASSFWGVNSKHPVNSKCPINSKHPLPWTKATSSFSCAPRTLFPCKVEPDDAHLSEFALFSLCTMSLEFSHVVSHGRVSFSGWISRACLRHVSQVYLLIGGLLSCSQLRAVVKSPAVRSNEQVSQEGFCFLCTSKYSASSFGCVLRARIAGSCGQARFNFWMNLHAALHRSQTVWALCSQCTRILISPHHCQRLLSSFVWLEVGV